MVIYKYELPIDGGIEQITGKFVKPLKIDSQNGCPVIWMECDNDYAEQTISLMAIGTGWDMENIKSDNCGMYYGTCIDGSGYVWHYYGTPFTAKKVLPASVADIFSEIFNSVEGRPNGNEG